MLVVNNDVPVRSVADLAALARAQRGKLTFGHSGPGTAAHLSGVLLKSVAGIDVQAVSYRGPSQIVADIIGGQITMGFVASGIGLPLIREGKIRGLAVTSRQPVPFAANLPTMYQAGVPGFDITSWFGLFAPAGTPPSIIDKLNREAVKITALPVMREYLYDIGGIPLSNTPAEFAEIIQTETPYWARLIQDLKIPRIE